MDIGKRIFKSTTGLTGSKRVNAIVEAFKNNINFVGDASKIASEFIATMRFLDGQAHVNECGSDCYACLCLCDKLEEYIMD